MTMYLGSINERVLQVTENDFAIIDPDHLTDEDRANKTYNRMALNTLYNGLRYRDGMQPKMKPRTASSSEPASG
jgi:hypothetical protein